ncbi:helix-turn-helix domain-containing protein [Spirosoma humi]
MSFYRNTGCKKTDCSLQKIASQCGFNSLSYFSIGFKEAHQVSPLRFRQSHRAQAHPEWNRQKHSHCFD